MTRQQIQPIERRGYVHPEAGPMDNDVNNTGVEQWQPGEALIAALAKRDFEALEACFDAGVRFRALIPPGVREALNERDTVAHFRRWFGDAADLELLAGQADVLADRLHVRYRFVVVDVDGRQVVEQQGYGDVRGGRIVRLDLLCSGFRPFPVSG